MDSEKRDTAVAEEVKQIPMTVQYIVYESAMARNERNVKRLLIIIAMLIVMLFVSNLIWVWFMYGTEFESYEVTADSNSNAYYNEIGNNFEGDVNNGGPDKSQEDTENKRSAGEDKESAR